MPQPPAWTNEGQEGQGLALRLEAYARAHDIEVVEEELEGDALGESRLGQVALPPGLSPLARAWALAHELAHEELHERWHRLGGIPKPVREAEAEAVAYVICAHYGLDINSPTYLALWCADGNLLRQRMDRIAEVAGRIIEALETMDEVCVLELPAATSVLSH